MDTSALRQARTDARLADELYQQAHEARAATAELIRESRAICEWIHALTVRLLELTMISRDLLARTGNSETKPPLPQPVRGSSCAPVSPSASSRNRHAQAMS